MRRLHHSTRPANSGLSLIELLVAMAIAVMVMSGVVQVLMVSKSNFITERELATLQENARYAVKYIQDEVRQARFNGCTAIPVKSFNAVVGASGHWARDGVGLLGFDNSQPASAFPDPSVLANTDALVVRRGDRERYLLASASTPNGAATSTLFTLNRNHDLEVGDIAVVSSNYCDVVSYLQVSEVGSTSFRQNDTSVAASSSVLPGNCKGTSIPTPLGHQACATLPSPDVSSSAVFQPGTVVMKLVANAIYVGASADGVPALYRERMGVVGDDSSTWSEELVQGVENMQVSYGLDNALADGVADIYMAANNAAMNWNNVVSVRVALRMRSVYPVYNNDETFGVFMGVAGTNGADRFMRQTVVTTITLRN